MAPIRLIQHSRRAETGVPLDVVLAGLLMALAWGFAGYLGVRLLDPKSDLTTSLVILGMITAYQVCGFAVAARVRSSTRARTPRP